MGFLEKVLPSWIIEKHLVGGRKINLIDRSNVAQSDLDFIKKAIIRFCAINKIAKLFPKITIYLESEIDPNSFSDASVAGWVKEEELVGGKPVLHLNIPALLNQKGTTPDFTEIFFHELTHLQQELDYGILEKKAKAMDKLSASLVNKIGSKEFPMVKKELIGFANQYLGLFSEIRLTLQTFFFKLSTEGNAMLIGRLKTKKIKFSLEEHQRLYEESKKTAISLKQSWRSFQESVKENKPIKELEKKWKFLRKQLESQAYDIGFYISYTIFFLSNFKKYEDIISKKPFRIV